MAYRISKGHYGDTPLDGQKFAFIIRSGRVMADFAPGEGGFVRGSLRALARMRMTAQVHINEPYRVIKWSNGSVSLSDTKSGQRIYLNAFGPDQVAAFEKFLGNEGRASQ